MALAPAAARSNKLRRWKTHAQKAQGQPSQVPYKALPSAPPVRRAARPPLTCGTCRPKNASRPKKPLSWTNAINASRAILLRQHGPDLVSICNAEHGQRQQKRRAHHRARVFL